MSAEAGARPPVITSLLVKVASRCNLSCDYCYMYEHADQSWRLQPRFMDAGTVDLLEHRVREHVAATGVKRLSVILHGGEPLLAGAPALAELARRLRAAAVPAVLDVGLQTNGVLLDEVALDVLAAEKIAVSLSLDGPSEVHDRHRPTKNGSGSHAAAMSALKLLRGRPEVFSGMIAVIDSDTDAAGLIRWFASLRPPALDLLTPDATHDAPPEGRDVDPDRYKRWLIRAFDTWYDEAADMPLRTFDALVGAVAGVPSGTDAFGFGEVSLLTVETDGSYHDLDVLKTTFEGRTGLGLDLASASIQEAAASPRMRQHGRLLSVEGLSEECRRCPEMAICAGGAVPHRYRSGSADDGFNNPSIYCSELHDLIVHVRNRVQATLADEGDVLSGRAAADVLDWSLVDTAERGLDALAEVLTQWRQDSHHRLLTYIREAAAGPAGAALAGFTSAEEVAQACAATTASAQLWLRAHEAGRSGSPLRDLQGNPVLASVESLTAVANAAQFGPDQRPALHRDDPMLRLPFGHPIVFIPADDERLDEHRRGLASALKVVHDYSPALRREISALCSDVQLIRDVEAHPDKVVSFSDDTVPGALYVGAPVEWTADAVHDVADSIIHEHRHQKLYLVGRRADLLVQDWPLVPSPWREEPRPPSGVLHAVFVFLELRAFWRWTAQRGPASLRERAEADVQRIERQLSEGIHVLNTCRLTPAGEALVSHLTARFNA